MAGGIVGAGESPGGSLPVFDVSTSPGFVTGFAFGGRGVKAPELLAGERVMSGDEAGIAITATGSAADDLTFESDRAGRIAPLVGLSFPALLAGAGIEPDDGIGGGIEDDVLIDG